MGPPHPPDQVRGQALRSVAKRRVSKDEAATNDKAPGASPGLFLGAPSMGIDMEVGVLPRAGHSKRSEPQSVVP